MKKLKAILLLIIIPCLLLFTACDDNKNNNGYQSTYTATFVVEGVNYTTRSFSSSDSQIPNIPNIPTKEGYNGEWENYTIKAENIKINAIYTPIIYTATFKANGEIVSTRNFTIENSEIVNLPHIPDNIGYIGKWEDYTIKANNITINAIYIPIDYSIVFKTKLSGTSIIMFINLVSLIK